MLRRAWLAAPVLFLAACFPEHGGRRLPLAPARSDALVYRPARQLALVLADLPVGFDVGEELVRDAPSAGRGLPDPFGRLSAYAVVFRAPDTGSGGRRGDVVSSVNAYVGFGEARAAFESWLRAIPAVYSRLAAPPAGAPPGAAVYVQGADGACLLGFLSHNVLASVRVGPLPWVETTRANPVEHAVGLAALVLRRIDAGAGR